MDATLNRIGLRFVVAYHSYVFGQVVVFVVGISLFTAGVPGTCCSDPLSESCSWGGRIGLLFRLLLLLQLLRLRPSPLHFGKGNMAERASSFPMGGPHPSAAGDQCCAASLWSSGCFPYQLAHRELQWGLLTHMVSDATCICTTCHVACRRVITFLFDFYFLIIVGFRPALFSIAVFFALLFAVPARGSTIVLPLLIFSLLVPGFRWVLFAFGTSFSL